jgi:hypothetical protein
VLPSISLAGNQVLAKFGDKVDIQGSWARYKLMPAMTKQVNRNLNANLVSLMPDGYWLKKYRCFPVGKGGKYKGLKNED